MTQSLTNVVPQLLAQGLMALRENAVMARLVNSDYDTMAAMQGSTITIPVPSAIAASAVTPSATPGAGVDMSPTAVSIALDQWYEAPFVLNDKEMLEVMNGTIPMQASEAIKSLGNQIDQDLLGLYTKVYGWAGTPDTTPLAASTVDATTVRKVLNKQLCPLGDRRMIIDPDAEANALNLRAFQDMSFSGSAAAILEGDINRKLGFTWFMDQNVQTHTCGTRVAGTTAVNQADVAIGDTSITVDSGTGAVAIGDVFTVAGDTQTYTASAVTADVSAGTLAFTPAAKVAWANGAAITFKGAANTDYPVNLAFHRDAIAFATRPLADNTQGLGNIIQSATDPVSGISLRLEVVRQHRRTRFAYDILYGYQLVRPEYACRLVG